MCWNIWVIIFRVIVFFRKFHCWVKLWILEATQYLPRYVQILVLFSFQSCKRNFVLNAWLCLDGTNIPRPLSLGRKRFPILLVPGFYYSIKTWKIILLISGRRSLGMGNTLPTYQSLDSFIVFIIIVFPFRERCLWFLRLFSIFWIHFVILYLFVFSISLLKWMPRIFTNSFIFHFIRNLLLLWYTLFVWIINLSILIIFSEHPVAVLYLENCSNINGISEKFVDKKLVSPAYCDSFKFSFLPGSLMPLIFGSLFTLLVNTSFWVQ